MKVQLAYPWEGYAPDEVIEVEDRLGRRLVSHGRARLADDPAPEPLAPEDMKLAELRVLCDELGINRRDLPNTKAALLDAIASHRATDPTEPDSGDDPKEASDGR